MRRNLDLKLLRTFTIVASTRNMVSASDVLRLTQGAISQQIKRLEETFQCNLFERTTLGLVLTSEGKLLLDLAKEILLLNDKIWMQMTEFKHPSELRFGTLPALKNRVYSTILKTNCDTDILFKLKPSYQYFEELKDSIKAGLLDLAVIIDPGPVDKKDGDTLFIERLVWAGAKEGVAYQRRPLPLVTVGEECTLHQIAVNALNISGIDWKAEHHFFDYEVSLMNVCRDFLITVMLESDVPDDFEIIEEQTSGLPALPEVAVKLYKCPLGINKQAEDFALFLKQLFIHKSGERQN